MMRSFALKTATLAAILMTLPFASAHAAGHHGGDLQEPAPLVAPSLRLADFMDQLQGVSQGIRDARQTSAITPATAQGLEMRAGRIGQAAERFAAANHGSIPATQYHRLRQRLDNLDQRLLVDTGNGFNIGDGSDGGNYPNG
jgi:hypothetical protein